MTEALNSFHYAFQVRLHDVDAARILFYGHLFRHAHDAYEALMASIGLGLPAMLEAGHWRLPLVHAAADYLQPISHGDYLEVAVSIESLKVRSYTVGYRFWRPADTACCAQARTVHVYLPAGAAHALPLPADLVTALTPFLEQPNNP